MFLPYLSGERTPHNDAAARGVFLGIGHETDRNAMTQAVLEGVAFAFRDCQRVLGDAGTDFARAAAVGGGAKSRLWLSILANVLNRPLDLPKDGEFGAALGAARLGMAAALGGDPLSPHGSAAIRRIGRSRSEIGSALRGSLCALSRALPIRQGDHAHMNKALIAQSAQRTRGNRSAHRSKKIESFFGLDHPIRYEGQGSKNPLAFR